MKRLIVFLICFTGSLWGEETKPVVIATISPYAFLIEKIAGGLVDVKTVVPPLANAHLFEPTPKNFEAFKKARLWIRTGEGFENQLMPSLLSHNSELVIHEAWKGVSLISHHHKKEGCCGDWDRHIWLSPRELMQQMPPIAAALIAICPEHREEISERLKNFLGELKNLDLRLTTLFSKKKGKAILVAHPSFSYFCRDYGLIQLSIEQEGRDPLPKHLQELFSKAKQQSHRYLFVQPQFSQKGAKQVADKLSLSLYTIDPYAYDYLESLEAFAQTIAGE